MRLQFLLNNVKPTQVVQSKLCLNVCSEYRSLRNCSVVHNQPTFTENQYQEEQFRVIELVKKKLGRRKREFRNNAFFKQPREQVQPITQDWGNVWPGPRTFHPATVPLPVRMGYPRKGFTFPDKWANAELMKIPNFLHLTPPVIESQCAAIKKFCTPWPKELQSEEAQEYFYPIVCSTSTFLHSSTTLRDPRSRAASLTISLDSLKLDWHAFDKLLRLVGDRFDPKTKLLTLEADRCPLSTQNLNYCIYLLTVIYNESLKTEPWEHEKKELDYENFSFERSKSKEAMEYLNENTGDSISEDDIKIYDNAVTTLHNEGETEETLSNYKDAVLKVLKLSQ